MATASSREYMSPRVIWRNTFTRGGPYKRSRRCKKTVKRDWRASHRQAMAKAQFRPIDTTPRPAEIPSTGPRAPWMLNGAAPSSRPRRVCVCAWILIGQGAVERNNAPADRGEIEGKRSAELAIAVPPNHKRAPPPRHISPIRQVSHHICSHAPVPRAPERHSSRGSAVTALLRVGFCGTNAPQHA